MPVVPYTTVYSIAASRELLGKKWKALCKMRPTNAWMQNIRFLLALVFASVSGLKSPSADETCRSYFMGSVIHSGPMEEFLTRDGERVYSTCTSSGVRVYLLSHRCKCDGDDFNLPVCRDAWESWFLGHGCVKGTAEIKCVSEGLIVLALESPLVVWHCVCAFRELACHVVLLRQGWECAMA